VDADTWLLRIDGVALNSSALAAPATVVFTPAPDTVGFTYTAASYTVRVTWEAPENYAGRRTLLAQVPLHRGRRGRGGDFVEVWPFDVLVLRGAPRRDPLPIGRYGHIRRFRAVRRQHVGPPLRRCPNTFHLVDGCTL
jgi:hypothetical protein